MTFRSFLKTPLFFSLCILSLATTLRIAGITSTLTGTGFLIGAVAVFAISALYTIFIKDHMQRAFKIWALAYAWIGSVIINQIWPIQPVFTEEAMVKLTPAFQTFVNTCIEIFGQLGASLTILFCVLASFFSFILACFLIDYAIVTLGNKVGLSFLKNHSEK